AAPRFCADESLGAAMVFGSHGAREVNRAAGHVGVHVNASGKANHSRGIDRAAATRGGDESASIVDEEIFDLPVDAVGRIVDFAARNTKHGTARLPHTCAESICG